MPAPVAAEEVNNIASLPPPVGDAADEDDGMAAPGADPVADTDADADAAAAEGVLVIAVTSKRIPLLPALLPP
jgi:hypothetical protein